MNERRARQPAKTGVSGSSKTHLLSRTGLNRSCFSKPDLDTKSGFGIMLKIKSFKKNNKCVGLLVKIIVSPNWSYFYLVLLSRA